MNDPANEAGRTDYWLELAAYDLATAEAMLATRRFLYVGFMCHQVIEKTLKAAFVKKNRSVPPYRHNLLYMAQRASIADRLTEAQQGLLDVLAPLNIEARYPAFRDQIRRALTEQRCGELLRQTRELHQWLTNQLQTK